ncbi:MAG: class I SAM-dependent methyltransferase [Planctomycetaceae bacterium]
MPCGFNYHSPTSIGRCGRFGSACRHCFPTSCRIGLDIPPPFRNPRCARLIVDRETVLKEHTPNPIAAKGPVAPVPGDEFDPREGEWKTRAAKQFERRSAGYQGSWAQRLYCRPTSAILLRQLPSQPRLRVLDIGCGTGQLLADVACRRADAQLHGVDLTFGMLAAARAQLATAGVEAAFVRGDSARLPFAEASFDLLVCTHSFHHYPDQRQVVGEFARVLSPGGLAMVLDGDPGPLWGRILYDGLVAWFEGAIHHCTAAEMQALFSDGGFCDIRQARTCAWSPVLLTVAQRRTPGAAG